MVLQGYFQEWKKQLQGIIYGVKLTTFYCKVVVIYVRPRDKYLQITFTIYHVTIS